MTASAGVGAVVLVRTTRRREEMARLLGSIEGVRHVAHVQGRNDLVVHAADTHQVDAIGRLPGVSNAEVCWPSSRSKGGAG